MSTVSSTTEVISLAAAEEVIARAKEKAEELETQMTIAVVDTAGMLKALGRMEGATILSLKLAMNKAYTAAISGFPTDQLFEAIKDDPPPLHGIPQLPDVAAFGGGLPITTGAGVAIGAVGVSGGHWSQDVEVAQAALEGLA